MALLLWVALQNTANEKTDSLKIALSKSDENQQLELLYQLSKQYTTSNFDTALFYTNQLIGLANKSDNKLYLGLAHKNQGNIYFRKGSPDLALKNYQSAITYFNKAGEITEIGNIYNNLGLLYQSQGEHLKALQVLKQAQIIFEDKGNEVLQTGPLINMGIVYFKTGDYAQASSYFLKALSIAQNHGLTNSMANITNNLGAIYKEWGKYYKALEFYKKSLNYRAQINDLIGEASTCHNIGIVYEDLGDFNNAANWVIKGLNIKKRIGAESKLSISLIKLGDIYQTWGKYELAADYYNKGIVYADKVGDKISTGNALVGLGNVFSGTEIYQKALSAYREAAKIFEETNSKKELAETYCELGSIYSEKFGNYNLGSNYFQKAETLLTGIESEAALSHLYFDKAGALIKQNKTKQAILYFNKSLENAPKNNYHILQVTEQLANAYVQIGQLTKAVDLYQKALQLKDTVFNTKSTRQLAKYEALYKNEQNKAELIRLSQESELDKLEIKKKKTVQNLYLLFSFVLVISLGIIVYINIKLKKVNQKLKLQQSEIEQQKKELEEANNHLVTAKTNAEKLSNFKSQFLANISHEIRTPLNAILGYSKLIKTKLEKNENINYAQNIENASENLLIIINDLIDFSRIEAGKMVIEKTRFNPVTVLTQTISTLRLKAETKNIKLDLHFDPDLPESLLGDPYRLSQILINLIANAIKFSHKGQTVTIEARCEAQNGHCQLFFSVKDQGIGIDNELLEHIFESFTQVKTNTIRNKGGTGLGLAIVKRLIELQNGEITVASKVNEGSDFKFTIDYEKDTTPKNEPSSGNTKSPDTPITQEVKILLVEDNEINQELAKDTIKSWGKNYLVKVAGNGKIAIQYLKEEPFHLVLMDIQMPVMDGHETTIYIREKMPPHLANIPIIGMTAHALESEKNTAIKNGMNEYIIKPFNPDELKQKINNFVTDVQ